METEVTCLDSLKSVLLFIQNELLGMEWLNQSIEEILSYIGLDINSRIGGSIQFFL